MLVRDERPWGGPAPPAVTYLYSPNRKSEHARTLLEGCRGFLHADGYAGFNGLYEVDSATSAARLVGANFFPAADPISSTLAAFAVFPVGFLARPLGGVPFGHVGDRIGASGR